MRTLVWGAGAIGGTLGAYLARSGHDVTFVDTVAEHVDAINRDGLRITGPIETFTVRTSAHTPRSIAGTWPEIVLATKAHHTDAAVRALAPHLAADGYVVSAQNGLNEIAIADVVGAARTVGSFVNFGADYLEPGVVHFGGRGAVVVGEIDGRMTPRVEAIRDAWRSLDARAIATPNIWGYLWGKEAYGAMLFATALTNRSIADALAEPRWRPVYVAFAREMLAVAAARTVTPEAFDGFDPHAYAPSAPAGAAEASLDALVAHNRRSAKTHSGVWRDLAVRKRPTEIDAQLGVAVSLGDDAGVPTPLTTRLVSLIHEIERGDRAQGDEAFDALAALASRTHQDPLA
ncbi:MAG: 2-dehydropantoate 2-reductase [Vicinamibacterales bacterium]